MHFKSSHEIYDLKKIGKNGAEQDPVLLLLLLLLFLLPSWIQARIRSPEFVWNGHKSCPPVHVSLYTFCTSSSSYFTIRKYAFSGWRETAWWDGYFLKAVSHHRLIIFRLCCSIKKIKKRLLSAAQDSSGSLLLFRRDDEQVAKVHFLWGRSQSESSREPEFYAKLNIIKILHHRHRLSLKEEASSALSSLFSRLMMSKILDEQEE